jgi:plastin-1
VTVNQHPEIVALMEPDEEVNTFLDLTPEVNLLRWFNYHLKRKGSPRRVTNFSSDLADSENYIVLLNSIAPDLCSLEALHEGDVNVRAQRCLENAGKIGCRQFLTPPDIVNVSETLHGVLLLLSSSFLNLWLHYVYRVTGN